MVYEQGAGILHMEKIIKDHQNQQHDSHNHDEHSH